MDCFPLPTAAGTLRLPRTTAAQFCSPRHAWFPVLLLAVLLFCPMASHGARRNVPRTLQLVVDSACQSQMPTLLAQWEADRRAEGWIVLKRIVAAPDPAALMARLRKIRPNHTFLVGDGVPFVKVNADPDGHGAREIVADYKYVQDTEVQPFGAIGRVWFKTQSSAGADSMTLYRRYFARRHTWPADQAKLGSMVSFDDHLSYRADGALWAKWVLEQVPPDRIEHLQLPGQGSDGELQRRVKVPKLIEIAFSGGQPFKPGGLFYFGQAPDWRGADPAHFGAGPKIGILGAYGSFLCELDWQDSFLTAAITTKYTVASFYDYQGLFPFGKMLTGSTLGDCGRLGAPLEGYISSVYGDPTIGLTVQRPATGGPGTAQ